MSSRGFLLRPVRKSSKGVNRETVASLHQKHINTLRDASQNLVDYFLDNGELLFRYADLLNHADEEQIVEAIDEYSIMKYFQKPEPSIDNDNHNDISQETKENDLSDCIDNDLSGENIRITKSQSTLNSTFNSILNSNSNLENKQKEILFEREYSNFNKTDIYNVFRANIDSGFLPQQYLEKQVNSRLCRWCGNEATLLPNDALLICENCGRQEKILIDINRPGYKEPMKDSSYFNYKKINHLNEWLAQFQAKESTDIPTEVYDRILLEIRKERITNVALLKADKLRKILKKLSLNKYYEHIPHIINRLNGLPPPRLTPEDEEAIRQMFRDIQTPFMKHCNPERKNFLSYSYVLHKFCLILDKKEFIDCFPLLKSREKLYEMDQTWKKICADLGWEFHRSI
jgi:hypothetical protein